MAEKAGNKAIEEGYFWIDSDDSWDMVDDQPKREVVGPLLPYYSSSDSDMDDAETGFQLEDIVSGIFLPRKRDVLALFLRKDPQTTPNFQEVVKEHILPFLPAKSLCRFRAVCKDWDKWIASPFFAYRQAQVFQGISGVFCQIPCADSSFAGLDGREYGVPDPSLSFLPDQVIILASHNGLLCCRGQQTCCYYVCNPATKKWEILPDPNFHHWSKSAVGLALDVDMLNFKANFEMVCAIPQPDSEFVIFEIYSSRTNSWRHVIDVCPELKDGNLIGNSFYSRGYIYWMVDSGFILVFHVREERCDIIKLPAGFGPSCALSELGGELCYLQPRVEELGRHCMLIYRGMEMSLKATIRLNVSPISLGEGEDESFRALGLANGNILLIILGRQLIAYNLREKAGRVLDPCVMTADFMTYLPYVNSLVPVCKPRSQLEMLEEYLLALTYSG